MIASNLLPSDAVGPIFFEAHDISCELEQVNPAGFDDGRLALMQNAGLPIALYGDLTLRNLWNNLPTNWSEQRKRLGFPARSN